MKFNFNFAKRTMMSSSKNPKQNSNLVSDIIVSICGFIGLTYLTIDKNT